MAEFQIPMRAMNTTHSDECSTTLTAFDTSVEVIVVYATVVPFAAGASNALLAAAVAHCRLMNLSVNSYLLAVAVCAVRECRSALLNPVQWHRWRGRPTSSTRSRTCRLARRASWRRRSERALRVSRRALCPPRPRASS